MKGYQGMRSLSDDLEKTEIYNSIIRLQGNLKYDKNICILDTTYNNILYLF